MHFLKIPIFFVITCLVLKQTVEADEHDLAKEISITTEYPIFQSQIDKRDSQSQVDTYNSLQQTIPYSSNDEPFKPIIEPNYFGNEGSTKYFSEQTFLPQASDVYYDSFGAASNRGTAKAKLNSPKTTPVHSNAPLAGSFLSTGGGLRYNVDTYQGPINKIVYQNERQQQPQKSVVKQETQIKSATATQASKGQQYNVENFETKSQDKKQNNQQQYQPQLSSQTYFNHRYQPYNYQTYTTPEQTTLRTIPKHHVQYIVAIPLSYLRQNQQQQDAKTGNLEQQQTPAPFIGPLARDHYGAYRTVQHSPSKEDESVSSTSNANPIQYTTQYIQLPTNVLHDAIQAVHNYQHNREQQVPISSYHYTQPQYTYYPQQVDQHQVPAFVNTISDESKVHTSQASTVPIGGSKSNLNYVQHTQKTAQIVPNPTPAPILRTTLPIPHTAPIETHPIVHYNPLYVQAPPQEQQSLFSGINYHRFTNGGFQATTPIPFVRLSHIPPAHNHYYTTLSHQPHQQHIHPFYNTYRPAHIPIGGLPYFTQPGGVHYGTHLYHPAAPTILTSPSISEENPVAPNKDLPANNQPTQKLYQQYATSGSYASSNQASNQSNNPPTNGNTKTESSSLVKYP